MAVFRPDGSGAGIDGIRYLFVFNSGAKEIGKINAMVYEEV